MDVGNGMTCQLERNSYQHAMRAPGEGAAAAKQKTQDFIHTQEHLAQVDQKGMPTNASDINDKSLSAFGSAGHTVADSVSPAHTNAQGDPLPWDLYSVSGVEAHAAAESTITPGQMNEAVNDLRQSFQATYGDSAAKQATTPPQPPQERTLNQQTQPQ
jgi:hypothetical protein